jgi:hypothetical protein
MGWKPPEPAEESDPLPMLRQAVSVVSALLP